MRTRLLATVLAAASTVVAIAGVAGATVTEHRSSGHLCVGATAADRTQQLFSGFGAFNDDAAATHAWFCPATWDGSISNSNSINAIITYYDRSSVDSLSCSLQVSSSAGSSYIGPTLNSCATVGGCATANAAFTSASLQQMNLTVTHPVISVNAWAVRCTVPRRSTSNGNYSGVGTLIFSHDKTGF